MCVRRALDGTAYVNFLPSDPYGPGDASAEKLSEEKGCGS